jgi:hypothetical protein
MISFADATDRSSRIVKALAPPSAVHAIRVRHLTAKLIAGHNVEERVVETAPRTIRMPPVSLI